METENKILTEIAIIAIQVLGPVLLGVLVALGKEAWVWVRTHAEAEKLAVAMDLARQFVLAAEEMGLKDELYRAGDAKYNYVIQELQAELTRRKIKLDLRLIDAAIRGMVHEEFNFDRKPEPQVLPAPVQ